MLEAGAVVGGARAHERVRVEGRDEAFGRLGARAAQLLELGLGVGEVAAADLDGAERGRVVEPVADGLQEGSNVSRL